MGIPMSISIAGMYAKAWHASSSTGGHVRRAEAPGSCSTWACLLCVEHHLPQQSARVAGCSAVRRRTDPRGIFWSLTPLLLVRNGGRGPRFLLLAGLAGVAIDGLIIPLASRLIFLLLEGFTAFGPIGTAMALLTWCGVIGAGWVITACASATW